MGTLIKTVIKVLTSPWIRRLLPLIIVGGLVAAFWSDVLQAVGARVVLPLVAALFLSWVVWQHRIPVFLHAWYRWLGVIAFAAALLGILAFFNPGDGILHESSLGGEWGTAIIRSQSVVGVFIVIALVLVGIACVAPYFSRRALRTGATGATIGARRTVPVMQHAGESGLAVGERVRDFYLEHPLHEMAVSWVRRRRAPAIREIDLPSPPLPAYESPPEPSATVLEEPKRGPVAAEAPPEETYRSATP